jgi:Xaa-Pro aminopeptidase
MKGYCSDITRMFHVGEPSRDIERAYLILKRAHQEAIEAIRPGTPCEAIDAAARGVITNAGLGEYFIHRVGHGIGTEAHEDPYMVAGNTTPLEVGHAFSVEPGIYMPGQWGMRLEDIIVVTPDGPLRLNNAARDIAVVA